MTVLSLATGFDPQVGDRVHVCFYSDVEPATVIRRTRTQVVVRLDSATLDPEWKPMIIAGGFAGHWANQRDQKWLITEDPAGRTLKFTSRGIRRVSHDRQEEVFVQAGDSIRGTRLLPGWRKFHDYNF